MHHYVKARAAEARFELENLLLSKEVWVAFLGMLMAIAKWQGVEIPNDVFYTIETLICIIVLTLSKSKKV